MRAMGCRSGLFQTGWTLLFSGFGASNAPDFQTPRDGRRCGARVVGISAFAAGARASRAGRISDSQRLDLDNGSGGSRPRARRHSCEGGRDCPRRGKNRRRRSGSHRRHGYDRVARPRRNALAHVEHFDSQPRRRRRKERLFPDPGRPRRPLLSLRQRARSSPFDSRGD